LLLNTLINILDIELNSHNINDYSPNGLQVEGKQEVTKIVSGVTASLALIEQAISLKADAILVHHGYFWKGESSIIVGMKKRRLQKLLEHDISLISYHLPIDVHPTLGNNAQIGKLLNVENVQSILSIKPLGIVMTGTLRKPMPHQYFSDTLSSLLNRQIISVGNKSTIKNVAWCTGGGQNFIDQVVEQSDLDSPIDAFISGEISEQTTHSALEQNIDFFAAGHHATERYGVKAIGEWLRDVHSLDVQFVDIDNPA
jgi:dinuclear metal center YbgI/SA1388 family protein